MGDFGMCTHPLKGQMISSTVSQKMTFRGHMKDKHCCVSVSLPPLQCAPSHISTTVCAICNNSNSQRAWQEFKLATVDSPPQGPSRGPSLTLVQHFWARAFVSLHHILLHQHHLVSSSLKTWYCSPCSFKSLYLSLLAYSPSGVVMLAQQGAREQNKLRPLNSIVFTMAN